MADDGCLPSPIPDKNNRKPTSFPRLFTTLKGFSETELPVMSPTSILDISKPFSALRNPFWSESNSQTPKIPEPETRLKLASKGIGLGIVDVLEDDKSQSKESKPETRMVLFGSQLKIQIPPLVPSPQDSPKSPAEFGIKTRNSQLGSFSSVLSPATAKKPTFGSVNSGLETPNSPQLFTGCLSATEMELSEDYTCVISHGPNPKTTHIFDNCIIENCCGSFSPVIKEKNGFTVNSHISYPSESFLSFCYACKKNLVEGKDIYMYRGEKEFCSRECRFQQMMLEKEAEELGPDDVYGTCS